VAISGTWKARQAIMASAKKQGTGINPVHTVRDGEGRNIAPETQLSTLPPELGPTVYDDPYDDNQVYNLWGYDQETGTSDRPAVGTDTQDFRNNTDDFPQWGPYENGLTGGSNIRDQEHGALLGQTPKQTPDETVSEGWLNKVTTSPGNSRTSDQSQLIVQTSGVQRYKTRAGSQVPGSGRQSTQVAPINSRVAGKKLKVFSGLRRHVDMFPQQQTPSLRPFWSRNAGTGYVDWMEPNQQVQVRPKTREVPPDPYTGPPVGNDTYGYTDEDMSYA
jgi:hypothetical protein